MTNCKKCGIITKLSLSRDFIIGGGGWTILKEFCKYSKRFFKIIFRPFCAIIGHDYEIYMIDSHWDLDTNHEDKYQIVKCARCSKCKKIKTK